MNATTRAIAYALAQWHANEPKPCQIFDFAAEREKRLQAEKREAPRDGAA